MKPPREDGSYEASKERLAGGYHYAGPDEYYVDKDEVRRGDARKMGMTENEYDPMGVWFGRMSN